MFLLGSLITVMVPSEVSLLVTRDTLYLRLMYCAAIARHCHIHAISMPLIYLPLAIDDNQVLQKSDPPESLQSVVACFLPVSTDIKNKQMNQVTQTYTEQQK